MHPTYSTCTFQDVVKQAEKFQTEFNVVWTSEGKVRFLSETYEFVSDIEAKRINNPRGLEFDNCYCAYEHIGAYC